MRKIDPAYIEILRHYFEQAKSQNSDFSLRKFAKAIGISPGLLSDIIKNKKSLPEKYLDQVIELMRLDSEQRKKFLNSYYESLISLHRLSTKKAQSSDEKLLDNDYDNRLISEWEYYAIFTLFDVRNSFNTEWASDHLGISEEKVKSIFADFLERNIVEEQDGVYKRKYDRLATTTNTPSLAIREAHKKTLDMAKNKIDKIPIDSRYYSSTTVAIDKRKIVEAKAVYREFREKLATLLEDGDQSEVYQFAFALFPLSQSKGN